jgi:hypothetical protein
MSRFALILVTVPLALLAQGCVHWRAVDVQDASKDNATVLQLVKHTGYLFWNTSEHVFFTCNDKGQELDCKRMCGGDTDLVCPSAVGQHTNVR